MFWIFFFPSLTQKFLIYSQFFLFRDAVPLTIKEIYQATNISTNNKTNSTLCSLMLNISSLTVIIIKSYLYSLAFAGDSVGKNLPTSQCRRYRFNPWLGRASGEENVTPLSILAWEIPWIEEPDELQSMGCKESNRTYWLNSNSNNNIYTSCLLDLLHSSMYSENFITKITNYIYKFKNVNCGLFRSFSKFLISNIWNTLNQCFTLWYLDSCYSIFFLFIVIYLTVYWKSPFGQFLKNVTLHFPIPNKSNYLCVFLVCCLFSCPSNLSHFWPYLLLPCVCTCVS